jgi:hypothetical protein
MNTKEKSKELIVERKGKRLNGLASPNYCWGFAQSIGRSRSIDLFQCISQGFLPTLQKNSRILTFFHWLFLSMAIVHKSRKRRILNIVGITRSAIRPLMTIREIIARILWSTLSRSRLISNLLLINCWRLLHGAIAPVSLRECSTQIRK